MPESIYLPQAYKRCRSGLTISVILLVLEILILFIFSKPLVLIGAIGHLIGNILIILGTAFVKRHASSAYRERAEFTRLALNHMAVAVVWVFGSFTLYEGFERIRDPVALSGWPTIVSALFYLAGNLATYVIIAGTNGAANAKLRKMSSVYMVTHLVVSMLMIASGCSILLARSPAIDDLASLMLIAPMLFFLGMWILLWDHR